MIWSTTALQDTTIFEKDPYRNSGLDQVHELRKEGDTTSSDLTESRILIQFNLTQLSNILSTNSINVNDISASLKFYTVQESELPKDYTIEARALSTNWSNGTGYVSSPAGKISNSATTDGATWIATAGTGSATWFSKLTTGSAVLYNTGSAGGGVFYTASVASQSFNFKNTDAINIDVTQIVKNWANNVFVNNGFVVSFKNNELTASNSPNTLIQLYSSDTHTVFEPQLYISWTGSITYSTGSMSLLTFEDSPIVYTRSFKGEYLKDKKVRVMLGSRAKYPRASFAQNSVFATTKALPANSYYQIKDAHNNEIIIPFSQFTKINTTSAGSYFDFYTTMLYPERYYKFEIKSEFTDITEYFSANDFTFKIIE
jgi:hypothetical protein